MRNDVRIREEVLANYAVVRAGRRPKICNILRTYLMESLISLPYKQRAFIIYDNDVTLKSLHPTLQGYGGTISLDPYLILVAVI